MAKKSMYAATYRLPPGVGQTGDQEVYLVAEDALHAILLLNQEISNHGEDPFPEILVLEKVGDSPPLEAGEEDLTWPGEEADDA